MTNSINVPRELLENIVLCYNEGEFELGTLAAECHALLSAPSPAGVDDDDEYMPDGIVQGIMQSQEVDAVALSAKSLKAAGVDGLEVVRKACEVANCKYPDMDAMADFKRDVTPSVVIGLLDGIRHAKGIAAINDARANGCAETVKFLRLELSDAQAIIDGLRGEVGAQRVKTCIALKERNDAREERDAALAECERLQMQLAACGVVALANTIESAGEARQMHPDYMSASCSDVADAVDREIALRAERDDLRQRLAVRDEDIERIRVQLMTIASADPAQHSIEWAKAMAATGNNEVYAKWREAFDERDQQAQRIGELEGLLLDCENAFADIGADEWCERIDAALSAVCAAAPNIAMTSEHSGS